MIFAGEDYTIEVRGIYFNVDDGSVFVRFVETPNEDEINGWDFLIEEGWETVMTPTSTNSPSRVLYGEKK